MIIFKDGLKLENKTLEEKIKLKQGFRFDYKGKTYTHRDIFAAPKENPLKAIREQLKLKGIIRY